MHRKDQEESAQETGQESESGTPGELPLATREEKRQKKAADKTICERAFH